jgi:hypothetical protein
LKNGFGYTLHPTPANSAVGDAATTRSVHRGCNETKRRNGELSRALANAQTLKIMTPRSSTP